MNYIRKIITIIKNKSTYTKLSNKFILNAQKIMMRIWFWRGWEAIWFWGGWEAIWFWMGWEIIFWTLAILVILIIMSIAAIFFLTCILTAILWSWDCANHLVELIYLKDFV